MLMDFDDGSTPLDHAADVCIVGGGPAGIAVAHSLLGSSLRVCLLESGGFTGEPSTQALYEGQSVGDLELDPSTSRLRALGGSCNLWGGGCIPLSVSDFEKREWVPASGWPISFSDLSQYYSRARKFCQLGDHGLTGGSFVARPAIAPLALDPDKLVNQVAAASPTRFGEAYRVALARAKNVHVLLHANVLELVTPRSAGSVRLARIASLGGHRGTVRARYFVLACGGIENARLLLLSSGVAPRGLGNDRDQVGRYFMDHPRGKIGTLFTSDPDAVTLPYDHHASKTAATAFSEIGLSEAAQRAHGILNARVRPVAIEGRVPEGIAALRDLRAAMRKARSGDAPTVEDRIDAAMMPGAPRATSNGDAPGLSSRIGRGVGEMTEALGRRMAGKRPVAVQHVDLIGYFEQAPNPDSRISLIEARDALGQRRVCVDWRLTALDRTTYREAAALFCAELARASGGHCRLEPWLQEEGAEPVLRGAAHHIGTTRMSDDPRHGVVDPRCRVHGVDNLYVAGSSVFPTGGWAFPTFTIVALSLRLADELKARATSRPSVSQVETAPSSQSFA